MDLDNFNCVYVDIDGTIGNCEHRQPFYKTDYAEFEKRLPFDLPQPDVIELVHCLSANWPIVICTGRSEKVRPQTEEWLKRHYIPYVALYMRPQGDNRSDAIVKVELLEKMRAEGWQPMLALEDRTRVVQALRAVGLRVLQVQNGDY